MLFSVNEEVALESVDSTIIKLCKYIHKLSKDKSKANELAANVKALAELIETRNKYEQKGKKSCKVFICF